jgi:hypothetical protein
MKTADALAEVRRHQSLIRDEIVLATRLADQDPGNWSDTLAQSRWRMFRLLRAYQLFKHNEIYDPTLQATNPDRVAQARALKLSCIATGERYQEYVGQWPADAMIRDAQGYRRALKEQATGLERQMSEELRLVELLLANVSRTRAARPAAAP